MPCPFSKAWVGPCNAPSLGLGTEFCKTHAAVKCANAGCTNQAIGECSHATQFVCGYPYCKACGSHSHESTSGITFKIDVTPREKIVTDLKKLLKEIDDPPSVTYSHGQPPIDGREYVVYGPMLHPTVITASMMTESYEHCAGHLIPKSKVTRFLALPERA